jgi:DNA-binding transcriptional ArsR family regulator
MTKDYNSLVPRRVHFEFVSTYEMAKQMSPSSFEKHYKANAQKAVHFQLRIADYPVFFYLSHATELLLNDLMSKNAELNFLYKRLPPSVQGFAQEKAVIEDLVASLSMEGISAKTEEVFQEIHLYDSVAKPALDSLSSCYTLIKDGYSFPLKDIEDLRHLYDLANKGSLNKDEKVDGSIFRKKPLKDKNTLSDESSLKYALKEALSIPTLENLNIYGKSASFDFFLRYASPFYVGNGTFRRLLATYYLYKGSSAYSAFFLSRALKKKEEEIQKSFVRTLNPLNRGDLSTYAYAYLSAISDELDLAIYDLRRKEKAVQSLQERVTMDDQALVKLLSEGTIYSLYGLSVFDLSSSLGVSERSLIRYLLPFKEKGLLKEKQIGKAIYYTLKNPL